MRSFRNKIERSGNQSRLLLRNQKLEDEINRLKGEKGKPKLSLKDSRKEPEKANTDTDTEKKKNWAKSAKKPRIKIDKTIIIEIDKGSLPPDAVNKGYRIVIVQNIKFETNNIEYKLERYYSPGENKLYEAKLPGDVNSEFGNELQAYIIYLYYACRVTENKIKKILEESGIIISEGQISNILTRTKKEEFTNEKEEIFNTALECSNYFHTDDTGINHNGEKYHAHVFCNDCEAKDGSGYQTSLFVFCFCYDS